MPGPLGDTAYEDGSSDFDSDMSPLTLTLLPPTNTNTTTTNRDKKDKERLPLYDFHRLLPTFLGYMLRVSSDGLATVRGRDADLTDSYQSYS